MPPKPGKRAYEDGCAVAHALNLVGDRWALLVVRELLFGAKRFTDLRHDLPGISTNMLAQRLADLDAAGVLNRSTLPPPSGARVYSLTDWGLALEPIVQDLARWAARSPGLAPGPMSVSALVLSMRARFDGDGAAWVNVEVQFDLAGEAIRARVRGRGLEVEPGFAARPDATVAGRPGDVAAVVLGGHRLSDAVAAGDLRIGGDAAALDRFLGLFPRPDRALRPEAADMGKPVDIAGPNFIEDS